MVFLDIETTTFFQDEHIKALPRDQQIAAMEFGIAVTIDSSEQSPRVWTKDQVVDLYNYLVWCGVEVCGWNIDAFDLPVIINNAAKAGWNTLEVEHETIRTLDLFADIRQHTGRWYGLGVVSEATLKRSKLADGQKAAECCAMATRQTSKRLSSIARRTWNWYGRYMSFGFTVHPSSFHHAPNAARST